MRIIATILAALTLVACSPVVLQPERNVVIKVDEAVLRGAQPCALAVDVDGERAITIKKAPGVYCPLPEGLLVPHHAVEGGDE